MNAKQRKILVEFKYKRINLSNDREDCKREFQAALKNLLWLCEEAEIESRVAARKSAARKAYKANAA